MLAGIFALPAPEAISVLELWPGSVVESKVSDLSNVPFCSALPELSGTDTVPARTSGPAAI